jgi:hypothetical protein
VYSGVVPTAIVEAGWAVRLISIDYMPLQLTSPANPAYLCLISEKAWHIRISNNSLMHWKKRESYYESGLM